MSYKVLTHTRAPGYRQQAEVIRRFRDFVWLQKRLRREFRGALVLGRGGAGCAARRAWGRWGGCSGCLALCVGFMRGWDAASCSAQQADGRRAQSAGTPQPSSLAWLLSHPPACTNSRPSACLQPCPSYVLHAFFVRRDSASAS